MRTIQIVKIDLFELGEISPICANKKGPLMLVVWFPSEPVALIDFAQVVAQTITDVCTGAFERTFDCGAGAVDE